MGFAIRKKKARQRIKEERHNRDMKPFDRLIGELGFCQKCEEQKGEATNAAAQKGNTE